MKKIALRFVKWGTGLLMLGLWTGFGPLHHYLHGHMQPSCPWAPVHAHVVLLGWVGFTLFGLVYGALRAGAPRPPGRRSSPRPTSGFRSSRCSGSGSTASSATATSIASRRASTTSPRSTR